ncbi:MAG: RdgB/HAM1 family non-canonical purine NTP pyrophosphatase [Bacteroidetes bacterium]|nr:RdgB/HAM1 family non-canonical purine NTP pyrophosphatase [Bacteroidota bacterium]
MSNTDNIDDTTNLGHQTDAGHTPNSDDWPSWATEPVFIVPPDPAWPATAGQEIDDLLPRLAPFGIHRIEHIGSTSVPGLPAKPIIDLITEIPDFGAIESIAEQLRPYDWHYVPPGLDDRPERRFFIRVRDNKRAVHLQFHLHDSRKAKDQRQFRDILRTNPATKEQYAGLKIQLAHQHATDREAYTHAKSDFVRQALKTIPMRIIFATNNDHKVQEIQAAIGSSLQVVSLRQAGINIDIPEPHDTLEANATEKSSTIHRLTGDNCFSEDTGLEVLALNGEPGVKSARYAGDGRSNQDNIQKLLHELGNNPDRRARFRTVVSLIWQDKEYQFEGVCNGHILQQPAGGSGFGYDPVFVPEGETRSFAQMSLEEKNRYSHRRKAADQLVAFLQKQPKNHD